MEDEFDELYLDEFNVAGGDVVAPEAAGLLDLDDEFQINLTEEKIHHDMLKKSYSILKDEHSKLVIDHQNLQDEHKRALMEMRDKQSDVNHVLENLQSRNLDLDNELKLLRGKVLTNETKELIKLQVLEEADKNYHAKFQALKHESENYFHLYSQIRKELAFVKGELESERLMYQTQITEMKERTDAEMKALQREREKLAFERLNLGHDGDPGIQKMRKLIDQNKVQNIRIEQLESEIEELTQNKEKIDLELTNHQRFQLKQTNELHSQISAAQSERQSLSSQLENVRKQLVKSNENVNKSDAKVQEVQCQYSALRTEYQAAVHKHEMDMNEMKLRFMNQIRDIERDKDQNETKLQAFESDVITLKSLLDRKAAQLQAKESEVEGRVGQARTELANDMQKLELEKLELQTKLSETEQRLTSQRHDVDKARDEAALQVANAKGEIASLKQTIELWKVKHDDLRKSLDALKEEHAECSQIQQRLTSIEVQLSAAHEAEKRLVQTNRSLEHELEMSRLETQQCRNAMQMGGDKFGGVAKDTRAEEDAKIRDKEQLASLTEKLKTKEEQSKHYFDTATSLKKKSKLLIGKLQKKVDLLKAKNAELIARCEAIAKSSVHLEEYNKLRRLLKDMQRKHNEYQALLNSTGAIDCVDIDGLDFAHVRFPNSPLPNYCPPAPPMSGQRQTTGQPRTNHHQSHADFAQTDLFFRDAMHDLENLKERIDVVEVSQDHQRKAFSVPESTLHTKTTTTNLRSILTPSAGSNTRQSDEKKKSSKVIDDDDDDDVSLDLDDYKITTTTSTSSRQRKFDGGKKREIRIETEEDQATSPGDALGTGFSSTEE